MLIYQSLYVRDFVSLKKYNDSMYKLTYFKSPVRQKGYEITRKKVRGTNKKKLENNLSRAKNKVFEYALCNDFEYFVTLTINKEKYARDNLKEYYKDFGVFLQNYNRLHKCKVEYIFIPELHSDGVSWHMHGLVKGIPKEHLVKNEHGYLDWMHYRDRFGWISLSPVKSKVKVSKYITKYINKNIATSIKELNAKSYYCTKGLKTALELKRGTLSANSIPYDFENDYVKIKWLNNDTISNSIE
ncbi:MAG: hypothetical protein Q8900_14080 [Bacillota bacterium]|nr:hypothetical protein [Bacillota bacterium]